LLFISQVISKRR